MFNTYKKMARETKFNTIPFERINNEYPKTIFCSVRGTMYEINGTLATRYPDSLITRSFNESYDVIDKSYKPIYLDISNEHINMILDYVSHGILPKKEDELSYKMFCNTYKYIFSSGDLERDIHNKELESWINDGRYMRPIDILEMIYYEEDKPIIKIGDVNNVDTKFTEEDANEFLNVINEYVPEYFLKNNCSLIIVPIDYEYKLENRENQIWLKYTVILYEEYMMIPEMRIFDKLLKVISVENNKFNLFCLRDGGTSFFKVIVHHMQQYLARKIMNTF